MVSAAQFDKIQGLIQKGIDEGAELVTGGAGRPEGLDIGFYVKPTVFADVKNSMTIAREEIFGPVLSILPYETRTKRSQIANDTPYGLSGYVSSGDLEHARRVAARLRTGNVHLNGAQLGVRRAVRRLQAVGQRPRVGRQRLRGVPRDQGRARLRGEDVRDDVQRGTRRIRGNRISARSAG